MKKGSGVRGITWVLNGGGGGCLSDAMDKERSMRQNYIYISVYSFLNKAFVLI